MQPRKDYDDYTKFINDTFANEKEVMLNSTMNKLNKTGGFHSVKNSYNPMNTLRTYSLKPDEFYASKNKMSSSTAFNGRNSSFVGK
jgi:hypothetical protein